MGLPNFYRKFVKDFSNITVPLTNIMGKKSKFYWGNDQEIAFKQIKEDLSSQPVMELTITYYFYFVLFLFCFYFYLSLFLI